MSEGSSLSRVLSDPGNLVLILIATMTIFLALHGETIIKVPRYRGMEILSEDSEQRWLVEDDGEFEKLEGAKIFDDPKDNPEWQPPCLPDEAPDYQAKLKEKAIKENLEETGMKNVIESVEEVFKEATKDAPATESSNSGGK